MRAHGTRNSNQILNGGQTVLGKNCCRSTMDHATSLGQKFVTRMLTRDVFAVANLLVSRHQQRRSIRTRLLLVMVNATNKLFDVADGKIHHSHLVASTYSLSVVRLVNT